VNQKPANAFAIWASEIFRRGDDKVNFWEFSVTKGNRGQNRDETGIEGGSDRNWKYGADPSG